MSRVIVQTKYRDISFEEVAKCLTPAGLQRAIKEGKDKTWEKMRSQFIEIYTPAVEKQCLNFCCVGPHFKIVGLNDAGVCPHIAEIGD